MLGAACLLGLGGAFAFIVIRLSDLGDHTAVAEAELLRTLVRVGVAMVIIAFLALIGAACAIAGLGNRGRLRLFPVLGLALNSLVVVIFAVCMFIGWASSGSPP